MNIFYVDESPMRSAMALGDRHVVKMILESAQLLSTAHRVLDGDGADPMLYKATHKNHPSAVWVRQSSANYQWLYRHFIELLQEYEWRYGKIHACAKLIPKLIVMPMNLPKVFTYTPMPQCMPDEYKVPGDSVTAYRNYYKHGKAHLHKWTNREKPQWL